MGARAIVLALLALVALLALLALVALPALVVLLAEVWNGRAPFDERTGYSRRSAVRWTRIDTDRHRSTPIDA